MNVQVYYQVSDFKETHDHPLLVARSLGALHDAVYAETKDKELLKTMDDSVAQAMLHLPDGDEVVSETGMHRKTVYAKRPSKDEKTPRIRDLYAMENLHECPEWVEYISTHFSSTIEEALMEVFIPCSYIPVKIPMAKKIYTMIKASDKNRDGFVSNIAIPAKDGLLSPTRRFCFPKEIPDIKPGLAKVKVVRNHTYGFMTGEMVHTGMPGLETVRNVIDILADAREMIRYPDMVMEIITREDATSLTVIYGTPAPRNRDTLPLAVMFHNNNDDVDEYYLLTPDGCPSEKDVRVNGFTANMLSIFAGDRKNVKVQKVAELIAETAYGMSLNDAVKNLKGAECIYMSKFNESRYTPIEEELPWAYPPILTRALTRGLLEMISLDNGTAKLIRVKDPSKLIGVATSDTELTELTHGMSEFNAIAAEEIIRLGRRNKIKIDNP